MAAMDADGALTRGLTLERAGRLAEAERAYRRAALLAPESAAPCEELARLLANAGRLKEALEVLRRALRLGDRSAAAYLTAGRILGRAGRHAEAEAAFARALSAADPARRREALLALGELRLGARLLPPAAQAYEEALRLEPGCARALFGLAAVRRAEERPEEMLRLLREAVAADPGLHEARAALAETLGEGGRIEEAAAEAAALLARPDAPPDLAVDCAARAAERGGDLAPALEAFFRRSGAGRGFDRAFCALLAGGRGAEAFRLGEAALDGFLAQASPCELAGLLWPWSRSVKRSVGEGPFCEELLESLGPARGEHARWTAYLRCVLLIALDRHEEALAGRGTLEGAPEERFFWMRMAYGLAALSACDPEAAEAELSAALARRPDLWWARCRLAESLLVRGREADARRELDAACALAREAGDASSLREALTWRGEVLLWLGDYDGALGDLDEASRLGAVTFTAGWRGAALLKLGRAEEALAELDRAVARDGKDVEALVWRGEARRALGRHGEAAADHGAALRLSGGHVWAAAGRALARRALGDDAGLREDFDLLPPEAAAWMLRRAGVAGPAPSCAELERALLAGLEAARGLRRVERYLEPLWLEAP